jgi:Tfp pilus assembly protein PilO
MKFLKSVPKEKLQKIVLAIIVTLIALGAMGNFWIGAQWSRWSADRDRIAKLKTDIEEFQAAAAQEASNTELRDQIKAFVDAQQHRMVSGDPFSWVVREVSLLAEKHPIRVLGMRPGDRRTGPQRARYELFFTRLEVEGTYDQLGVFLRDLENTFATSQIRSLEMSAPDSTRPVCRMALDCAFPVLPQTPAKPTEGKTS